MPVFSTQDLRLLKIDFRLPIVKWMRLDMSEIHSSFTIRENLVVLEDFAFGGTRVSVLRVRGGDWL